MDNSVKFSCVKENLERALTIAERFTGKNVTLPILGNILFETERGGLRLSATNLEYAVELTVPGNLVEEGKVTVPAKIASSLIQSISEKNVDLEEKRGNLHVRTDARNIRINGMEPNDFPLIPKIKKTSSFAIESFSLQHALEKVLPAVSPSEFKPELTGVYFKVSPRSLHLAATDTFRLAEKVIELPKEAEGGNFSFILPHRIAQELARILGRGDEEVTVSVGENQAVFEIDGARILSRLIDGNFPEYSAIIPKNFETTAYLKRDEFIDAIRTSAIFASRLQEVTLSFRGKAVEVASANPEVGEHRTKITTSPTGKEVTLGFNYRYLLDGLGALDEEEFLMGVGSLQSPACIRNKGDTSFTYVLMPIRLT